MKELTSQQGSYILKIVSVEAILNKAYRVNFIVHERSQFASLMVGEETFRVFSPSTFVFLKKAGQFSKSLNNVFVCAKIGKLKNDDPTVRFYHVKEFAWAEEKKEKKHPINTAADILKNHVTKKELEKSLFLLEENTKISIYKLLQMGFDEKSFKWKRIKALSKSLENINHSLDKEYYKWLNEDIKPLLDSMGIGKYQIEKYRRTDTYKDAIMYTLIGRTEYEVKHQSISIIHDWAIWGQTGDIPENTPFEKLNQSEQQQLQDDFVKQMISGGGKVDAKEWKKKLPPIIESVKEEKPTIHKKGRRFIL